MKKWVVFILLAGYSLTASAIKNYKIGDTLTVFAQYGIKLRKGPSKDSSEIIKIPFGKKVIICGDRFKKIPFQDVFLDIHTIKGFWVEVITEQGVCGFVFDGYLSSLPAPVIFYDDLYNEKYSSTEEAYLSTHFKKVGKVFNIQNYPENGEEYNFSEENPNSKYRVYSQKYAEFIEYTHSENDGGATNYIEFEKHSLEEILLLAKIIIDHFKSDYAPHRYIYNEAEKKYMLGVIDDVGCTIEITTDGQKISWSKYCGC